ncbi:hypothetical protein LXL04_031458 [Taraxacum kok-saghyz]
MLKSDQKSMQKGDQELMKHMCKLCNKSFPCGRSLGGHMRSHVINSTDHHHKMKLSSVKNNHGDFMDNKNTSVINGGSSNSSDLGYELRKDPKKTLKAKDSSEPHDNCLVVLDKLCKECGKGFQSWKALFGHMKCHSEKVLNTKIAISHSGNDNLGAKSRQIKKSRSRNGATKKSIVTCPTTPTVTPTTTTTTTTVTATASSSVSMNANNASTSVVSDMDQEQEVEIATCLIMLSRDVGKWGKKITANGYKMKKLAESEVGFEIVARSEVDFNNFEKTTINEDEFDNHDKRKFECATCNKSFHSYQALGGHRASHNKLKGCFDLKNDNKTKIENEPMLYHDDIIYGCCEKTSENHQSTSSFNIGGSLKNTLVVGGAHECSICFKIFSSGQALGGHKRSHLIAEAKLNQQNPNLGEKFSKPVHEIRGFLDLNMPPEEEEEEEETMMVDTSTRGTGYNPWCYNHESTLLGLLSTS